MYACQKNLHKITMSANSSGGGVKALADTSTKNASFLDVPLREQIKIRRLRETPHQKKTESFKEMFPNLPEPKKNNKKNLKVFKKLLNMTYFRRLNNYKI